MSGRQWIVFEKPRGREPEQLGLWRLCPTPYKQTMVDIRTWNGLIFTVRAARPLTRNEAAADLCALARDGGPLPSRYMLGERWGWPGEAGASRARRLAEDVDAWIDAALVRWNDDAEENWGADGNAVAIRR